jgi:potassium inwardly-rectifying channel subfamily J
VLKDLFISSIHLSWSWTCFNFFASYFVSWFFFALIWYCIALAHGDLEPHHPAGHVVCVENLVDFTSSFLYSIETQHTIG